MGLLSDRPNSSYSPVISIHKQTEEFQMIVYNTFLEYEKAQIEEIEKFIWCEGERRGHDPLCDCSKNDLYMEWIQKYAHEFRATHSVVKECKKC